MEAYGRVYLIWNMVNGKRYVGKTTKTVEERFKWHSQANNTVISQAIHNYRKENFRYGVIKTCATKEELDACEIFYIAALKSKAPYGYNMTDGGDGCTGFTPEMRKKMSEARRGKSLSPEHCAHISEALKGKTFTPERCAHIAEALKGRSLSLEHREKISASGKGKKRTPEQCAHISEALTGIPKSHEHRIRTSLAKRTYSPFKNLLAEMDARKMSYTDLAKLMGFATTTSISEKMRCKKKFTERDNVKLVEIFGKPIEYLLARDDTPIVAKTPAPKRHSPFKNLLAELDARQMSYYKLAELLGLSYTSISAKMSCKIRFSERDNVKLVEIFGKPIEYLLARDDG